MCIRFFLVRNTTVLSSSFTSPSYFLLPLFSLIRIICTEMENILYIFFFSFPPSFLPIFFPSHAAHFCSSRRPIIGRGGGGCVNLTINQTHNKFVRRRFSLLFIYFFFFRLETFARGDKKNNISSFSLYLSGERRKKQFICERSYRRVVISLVPIRPCTRNTSNIEKKKNKKSHSLTSVPICLFVEHQHCVFNLKQEKKNGQTL